MPLELVHRTRASDAFPTRWTRIEENRFLVTARWVNDHAFFAPVHDRRHDPLLVVESLRQAAMLVIHAGYNVPVGYHFMLTNLAYDCDPARLDAAAGSTEVEMELTFSELKWRGGQLSQLRIDMVLRRDGWCFGRSNLSARLTNPAVYRRLRGDGPFLAELPPKTAPVPPRQAGRTRACDVVLSPTSEEQVWQLRVDTGHRTLFQRPKDHVPGMLLLEAARQAASLTAGRFMPASGDIEFYRYTELSSPCWIQAHVLPTDASGGTAVRVTGCQDDCAVFRATLLSPAL